MRFEMIPQPVSFLTYQSDGEGLAVVRDVEGFYWIIKPNTGWVNRPRFASLDTALSEASGREFLDEDRPTPHWSVLSGRYARDLFAEVWTQE